MPGRLAGLAFVAAPPFFSRSLTVRSMFAASAQHRGDLKYNPRLIRATFGESGGAA